MIGCRLLHLSNQAWSLGVLYFGWSYPNHHKRWQTVSVRRRRKRPAVAIPRPSCPNNRTRPLRCRSEHIPLENSARVLLALVLRSRFCVVCVSVVPL